MTDRPSIMFVVNSLQPGGAGHVLVGLADRLAADERYRPIVVCLKERGPLAKALVDRGIAVYEYLLDDKYDCKIIGRFWRLVRAERVQIIVSVGSSTNRVFWSTVTAKLAGVKLVIWSQTYSQPGHPCFDRLCRVLYPLADRFVALGRRHKRNLVWFDKVPGGRISVIPIGVQVERFDHPQLRDRARSILGLADENVVAIGMIGSLRPHKRHDIFIEAAKQLVKRHRQAHFFIIGDGPNRRLVHHWAQQSDLLGQYLSMVGHRDDVGLLLPGLDLLCVCSEYRECLSAAALQAMAARVPVVSNMIGSMDEAISDEKTGFFYHQLSAAGLADRLAQAIRRPKLRNLVAEQAYRQVQEKFTTEKMAEQFIRLFDELLTVDPTRQIC